MDLPSERGRRGAGRDGTGGVARAYRDAVRTAYAAPGPYDLHAFDGSTDAPPALVDLVVEAQQLR